MSNALGDWDFWQHLTVGKAIWSTHSIPTTNVWTWPSYGSPALLPSWLFRALLWPFWSAGGVLGLFAWRWLTTLLAFTFLWLTARRLGARGLAPFAVMVVCALVYRGRSQVRPETFVIVLMALEMLILETRRRGGRDWTPWLIPLVWIWINAHISYHLAFILIGIHWLDAVLPGATRGRTAPRAGGRLFWIALLALAVAFVNPFGWRSLWQPFEYFLHLRNEPIFVTIGELQPAWVHWPAYTRNGYPLLMLGWPLLLAWRARRSGLDRVELMQCVVFSAFGLFSHRFTGFYAIVAASYVARGLGEWLASRGFVARLPVLGRVAAAAAFIAGITALELTGPFGPPRLELRPNRYPFAAADFMADHGVRGHGFNYFHYGGYQLFRFWPERDRLPFMGIHPESESAWNREYYFFARSDSTAWRILDQRYDFDYALLSHQRLEGERLPDVLDADSTWALVFIDDPASLYVRRRGALAEVARRYEYRKIGGGTGTIEAMRIECRADSDSCAVIVAELERAIASSPANAEAHSLLANADLLYGRFDSARRHLRAALVANPYLPKAHERLGLIDLREEHPAQALDQFLAERRIQESSPRIELLIGQAQRRLGRTGAARAAFRRVIAKDAANAEARDSLAVLERQR